MSVTVLSGDQMAISAAAPPESQSQIPAIIGGGVGIEVEFAECDCCGLIEEYTRAYVARIRERYQGRWICGLCAEAVKDEIYRSRRLIGTDEAFLRHMNFCKKFASTAPMNTAIRLISAVRQILKRSFDSTRSLRSSPNSPRGSSADGGVADVSGSVLARSESCFSTLSR